MRNLLLLVLILAANTNILLAKANTLLAKDNTLLAKDRTLLAKDNTLLAKDNTLLAKDNTLLAKDNTLLAKGRTLTVQDNANNVQETHRTASETTSASPSFVLNIPAFANEPVSLRDYDELAFSWQLPDAATASVNASYRIQFSPNGAFDADDEAPGKSLSVIGSDDKCVTVAQGYDTDHLSVSSRLIDSYMLTYYDITRQSDCPKEPVDVYLRCKVWLDNGESLVSNIIKISVILYANHANSTNLYLIGEGIGDGQEVRTKDGIGRSMIPLDINEGYLPSPWSAGHNTYTGTVYLDKNHPFWFCQTIPTENIIKDNNVQEPFTHEYSITSRTFPPTSDDEKLTVSESGWYDIKLVREEEKLIENGEWIYGKQLTLTPTSAPASTPTEVKIEGGTISQSMTANSTSFRTLWYTTITVDTPTPLHFVVDGTPWGDCGFSFGYAKAGSDDECIAQPGTYTVTFNAITGFYDFYELDDDRFIHSYLTYSELMSGPDSKGTYDGTLQVKPVAADLTEADSEGKVRVFEIVEFPANLERGPITLVIDDIEISSDEQGRVDAEKLNEVVDAYLQSLMPSNDSRKAQQQIAIPAYIYCCGFENGLGKMKQSNTFNLELAHPEAITYYIVGAPNAWNFDASLPLSTTDGICYTIDLPRNDEAEEFYVFNFDTVHYGDFTGTWLPEDADATEGTIVLSAGLPGNGFRLPAVARDFLGWHLNFDLQQLKYKFEEASPTGIKDISSNKRPANKVYTIDGRFVGHDLSKLPKGIYIANGRKIAVGK